jgi:hypothetical protein
MRSGSVENTYAGGHGGGVGGPVEVKVEVGGEDWGLGAGEAVAFIASTAACGGEGGSGRRRDRARSRRWGGEVRSAGGR